MLLRRAILIAMVAAPFVFSPSNASAQTALDRAAVATARADEVGAGQNSQAPEELPPGIVNRFSGETLPPGIRRTRAEAEVQLIEEEEPPETLTCLLWVTVGWSGFTPIQECVEWGTP